MPEPNTPNVALIVPNTGDLVDTWGSAAVNPDFVSIDGMFGGTLTIPLSSGGNTILTLPPGSISPTAGPNQSQNACINLTGTLTGNQTIQLGMPGRYVFNNQCLPLTFFVLIYSGGGGTGSVALPPGATMVYHDGTNVFPVNAPPVGSSLDLVGVTVLPLWISASSPAPYLIKNGAVFNISAFPALGHMLGNTFGGDGVNTFGVPNEMGRSRVSFDQTGSGRYTSPVDAGVMGSAGGEQAHTLFTGEIPSHSHVVTDPQHIHTITGGNIIGTGGSSYSAGGTIAPAGIASATIAPAFTGVSIQNTGGSGSHNNVQPSIVSTLPLVKT